MGGLKALPKGSAERGKFITQHMNHGPFLAALGQHPQGKQVHAMLTQHLNGAQNAGFKAGGAVAVVKSEYLEARESAVKLLKGIRDLLKGDVIKFPGNKAPAQDQGKPAAVRPMYADPTCEQCLSGAHDVLQNGGLDQAIGPQSAKIFQQKHPAGATPELYRTAEPAHKVAAHKSLTNLMHARHGFKKK